MTVMHKFSGSKLWFMVLLVLLVGGGCCGSGTTGLTAPTVTSVTPAAASNTTCPNGTVTVTFDEGMTPNSINATTFTLTSASSGPVAGLITYDASSNTATFTPGALLLAGVSYTATITTGVIDLFGNHLAANYVWSFTTAANGCNPPPTITSVTPPNGANGICPDAAVTAVFSQAMMVSSINAATFTLTGPGGTPVTGQVTFDTATTTATFTPGSPLSVNTVYKATITTGVLDIFGNPLAKAYSWTFTTAANGCNPPPTVVSVTPPNGSTGVCNSKAVTAVFSETMNASTITNTTFTLTAPGAVAVAGVVTYDATTSTATFTPTSPLALSTLYTATITTGVKDQFGNQLAANYVWSFTTSANTCIPPTVISVTPPNGSNLNCPNKVLTATFSEAMNPSTIDAETFLLATSGGVSVSGTVSYDSSTNMAIFAPTAALALSTKYVATITTGAKNLAGDALAANYTWTFTTGASTCVPAAPPISVTPPNGSAGVCPNTVIAATFTEAMTPSTLNATTFTVTAPDNVAVAGAVTADVTDKVFTFTPAASLALSTTYTVTITTGAEDATGDALASNYVWTFTTAATACNPPTAPEVIDVTPPNGSIGVCLNSLVTATFNEPMNPSTINLTTFTLSPAIAGAVTLDSTGRIATFTGTGDLAVSTTYTATITTGAMDLNGVPLAAKYTWSFTTAAQACQAPIQLGTAGLFEILAGTTVTSTGGTIITGGNLGLSPGSAVTGFPPGQLISPAVMYLTDPVAAQAELDLTVAYNDAAGLAGGAVLPGNLAGLTLYPGLYTSATTVMLSNGNVTLDAQGNSNAVFIFQVGSALTTIGGTQVILAGGAQAKNVFWQVGSSATLGTTSVFQGTIMALTSITLDDGAVLNGRALAINGAVTLDNNAVSAPQ